jgi:GNAT superfamily N-acetyltransferase
MIGYSETRDFEPVAIRELFESLNWSSAAHAERVAAALSESDYVASAWEGGELIGLVSVISDRHMTAYVPYAAVRPDRRNSGIGRALMEMVNRRYADLPRIALIAVDEAVDFYLKCGYSLGRAKKPMFITSLGL